MYSKFFDNQEPLPHHIHHSDEHAARTGQRGKPEAYYFPPQVNNHGGTFRLPFSVSSPAPPRTRCARASPRSTRATTRSPPSRSLSSPARHRLERPRGRAPRPGSLCTYEPQRASDVFAMYQSVIMNRRVISCEFLWKNCPPDRMGDLDWLLEVIDWERNIDPEFRRAQTSWRPVPCAPPPRPSPRGYRESWIVYRSHAFSAKELTVLPGRSVTVRDAGAYGLIAVQGHGTLGDWPIESPTLIRYGNSPTTSSS